MISLFISRLLSFTKFGRYFLKSFLSASSGRTDFFCQDGFPKYSPANKFASLWIFLIVLELVSNTKRTSSSAAAADNSVLASVGGGWGQFNKFIAYCWHSVAGYSKIGTYTGDGNTSGNIITTGFEPSLIMFKPTTVTGYWYVLDNVRNTSNPRNTALFPNDTLAEITSSNYDVDFLSTGFELKNNTVWFNQSGVTYLYMAFKQN